MMQYRDIAKKIIDLKNADLALRDKLINEGKLSDGYNEEMKTLHNKNAQILDKIMNTYSKGVAISLSPIATQDNT
ncbi:hypothetical protein [Sphingobacterium zeae]|uniref:hypothetical protein n=1 Tax=Sphingobacterium zeae TaxID=1776859 RepID=UPI003607E331